MELQCRAILFDLDGVLVDSVGLSERHWRRWAELHDVPFERIKAVHHGRPGPETIRLVAPHLDANAEGIKRELEEAADTVGLIAFKGAEKILSVIPNGQWAVVTSSRRQTAVARMNLVGLPVPEILITADDVDRAKPAPDPYQLAAQLLGFSPSSCVVIEDAESGIESGRAAGAKVIAIATRIMEKADFTIQRLSDIEIAKVDASGLQLLFDRVTSSDAVFGESS